MFIAGPQSALVPSSSAAVRPPRSDIRRAAIFELKDTVNQICKFALFWANRASYNALNLMQLKCSTRRPISGFAIIYIQTDAPTII